MGDFLGNTSGENILGESQSLVLSPFAKAANESGIEKLPFVAFIGKRKGYIQLATSTQIERFQDLPASIFLSAKAWASILEGDPSLDNQALQDRVLPESALKIYWFILSDVVPHLHIHLYPRWGVEEAKGINLFQERDNPKHLYPWTSSLRESLASWAKAHHVYVQEV
jgi:hypothetical protein